MGNCALCCIRIEQSILRSAYPEKTLVSLFSYFVFFDASLPVSFVFRVHGPVFRKSSLFLPSDAAF